MSRKINKIFLIVCAAFVAHTFISCKTTEKNYKAAYDAALSKREQAAKEQMRPASGLLSDDGPMLKVVNGDTLFVSNDRVFNLDGSRNTARYFLAIGVFKMDTNARAGAEALKNEGFPKAAAMKAPGGRFFTIADYSSSLDSIIDASKQFKHKFPDYPYIGLPGNPVIIGR